MYVPVLVRGRKAAKTLQMLVDAGPTYVVLDSEIIRALGLLKTPFEVKLTLADGRKMNAAVFLAEAEAGGRKGPILVVEIPIPDPRLGVHALETLGFKVNPRTGELEEISPEGGYLLWLPRCALEKALVG